MNANSSQVWTISLTEAAMGNIRDLKLTTEMVRKIELRFREVARLIDPREDADVQPIMCTGKNWYRLKMNKQRPSIRAAFSIERNNRELLIHFIGVRADDTYSLIELLYRECAKAK